MSKGRKLLPFVNFGPPDVLSKQLVWNLSATSTLSSLQHIGEETT